MKILIDPNMAILVKDMPESECAELLHCIFEYPNRDSNLIVWKYMKTQIDRDAQKYREKMRTVGCCAAPFSEINAEIRTEINGNRK